MLTVDRVAGLGLVTIGALTFEADAARLAEGVRRVGHIEAR